MIDRFEPKMKPRLNVLHPEDIEEVYSATMEVLEKSKGEGIILSVGGGVSPGMPRENILAMQRHPHLAV